MVSPQRRVAYQPAWHVVASVSTDSAALHHPEWLIAVDGGGTGTRVCVQHRHTGQTAQAVAQASALGQGVDAAWVQIIAACEQAFSQLNLAAVPWAQCAMAAGLSGTQVPGLAQDWLEKRPPLRAVVLDGDGVMAVLGAHGGAPGAVVVAGTGSVAVVLDAQGQSRQIGGWGYRVGDEGSGAWLGKRAVQHAHQASDGRVLAGDLAQRIWALTGRSEQDQLHWDAHAGQAQYASLAPLVFQAAQAADPVAQALLDSAAHEIASLACAVDALQQCPVVLTGSIAQRLQDRVVQVPCAQVARLPERLVEPQADAVQGGLQLLQAVLQSGGM